VLPDIPQAKWIGGIAGPLVLALSAIRMMVVGEASLRERYGGSLNLSGFDAVLLGIALLALAVALHGWFYWSQDARLSNYAPIPVGAGLLIFVIAMFWMVFRQFANFF
jgi:hypothetical protein